jgi:hypothetical protein
MIKGAVNSRLEPMVQMAVLDALGNQQLVDALVDTGFNGTLALPTVTRTGEGAFMFRLALMVAVAFAEKSLCYQYIQPGFDLSGEGFDRFLGHY